MCPYLEATDVTYVFIKGPVHSCTRTHAPPSSFSLSQAAIVDPRQAAIVDPRQAAIVDPRRARAHSGVLRAFTYSTSNKKGPH